MKRCLLSLCVVAACAWGAGTVEHGKGFLWLEAENFSEKGDWKVDTQFDGPASFPLALLTKKEYKYMGKRTD